MKIECDGIREMDYDTAQHLVRKMTHDDRAEFLTWAVQYHGNAGRDAGFAEAKRMEERRQATENLARYVDIHVLYDAKP